MTATAPESMLRLRDVRVDGVRSPVLEGGPPDTEEAVVFVHGNPGSWRDWEALAVPVSQFARVVAPTMPGFGDADKPETFAYTVEGYARHLAGILAHLGVRRAHLVLHDFGGPWGLAWAAAHPDQLASLSLINIGVLPGYRWHYLARIWRTPLVGKVFMATTTRPAAALLLRHGNPRRLPKSAFDRIYRSLKDRGTQRAVLRLYRATPDPGALTQRLAAALPTADLPVLVIWGKHDPYLPVRYAERQRAIFPRARVVVLERSGHWPYADDPRGVADALVPFLRGVAQATGAAPGT
jgi:pimeloyl-ACP methyl ester carboxylesterase